ncbi:tyrosine-type recombinase/integrase [Haladaptatus sp. GCM10025707]|uniref:tyrosine-type recombinase/integrase n=1 Tax=unclassified Haladaptatus TaxID=2622732 RepID=UPI0023E864D3|nr:tyrosine-type recombinase/integrase [Haladaptatus sp. QDMS2]
MPTPHDTPPTPDSTDSTTHPSDRDSQGEPIQDALPGFIASKSKGETGSGNYQRNAERVITQWAGWQADRGVYSFDDLDIRSMREYARYLTQRVRAGGIAASTAHNYYAIIRAFLTWCVREELLDDNPAAKRRAEEELPDKSNGTKKQPEQFWSPRERREIMAFVNQRAHDAIDDRGFDAIEEARDRALVALLAYSGVRGAEVFSAPGDSRRNGLTWADVDLDAGILIVLGKSQEREPVQLPPQAREPLGRYREMLSPPTPEWPVFPTRSAPTLYKTARQGLRDQGYSESEIDDLLDEYDTDTLIREYELVPPSLTTTGARSVMKRLCAEANFEVAGDSEYLTLHGARRGLGETLYREHSPAAAQRALRHKSPETTSRAYAHIEASDLAEQVGDVLDDVDR